jgi:hypothetical protein
MTQAEICRGCIVNEDVVNMEIRKFLKKVGITSQREIEKALQKAAANGKLAGGAPLDATMTLEIAGLGLSHTIDGKIAIE